MEPPRPAPALDAGHILSLRQVVRQACDLPERRLELIGATTDDVAVLRAAAPPDAPAGQVDHLVTAPRTAMLAALARHLPVWLGETGLRRHTGRSVRDMVELDAELRRHDPEPPQAALARLWLHLPSGTAGLTRAVEPAEPGTVAAGPVLLHAADDSGPGGNRLFDGLYPRDFDRHGFGWAGRATSDVQAAAKARGWMVVSRREAARWLLSAGWVVPPRRDGDGRCRFHDMLWEDQVDDLTWHVRESWDGAVRFVYERSVFVRRERS